MKPLKSIPQFAELCGISPWTVRSYIKQGKLKPIRIGRRVLFEEQELERFIRRNSSPLTLTDDDIKREAENG